MPRCEGIGRGGGALPTTAGGGGALPATAGGGGEGRAWAGGSTVSGASAATEVGSAGAFSFSPFTRRMRPLSFLSGMERFLLCLRLLGSPLFSFFEEENDRGGSAAPVLPLALAAGPTEM